MRDSQASPLALKPIALSLEPFGTTQCVGYVWEWLPPHVAYCFSVRVGRMLGQTCAQLDTVQRMNTQTPRATCCEDALEVTARHLFA